MSALIGQIAAYRTADRVTKRATRAAVVDSFRPDVAALVRELAPSRITEGVQVGLLGVLVAVETAPDEARTSAAAFRMWARRCARTELQTWLAVTQ